MYLELIFVTLILFILCVCKMASAGVDLVLIRVILFGGYANVKLTIHSSLQ